MPDAPPAPAPSAHLLARPTERQLLDGLARWLGPDETDALWSRVCAYEGLRRPVIDIRALTAGAEALIPATDGRAKITVRCFLIRTRNFLALTKAPT